MSTLSTKRLLMLLLLSSAKFASGAAVTSQTAPVRQIFDPRQPAVLKELDRVDDDLMACVRRASTSRILSSWDCRCAHSQTLLYEARPVTIPALYAALQDELRDELRADVEAYGQCVVRKAYGSAHVDRSELDDCRSELTWRVNRALAARHAVEVAAWTAQAQRAVTIAPVAIPRSLPSVPKIGPVASKSQLATPLPPATYSEPTMVDHIKDSWGW